MKKHPFQFWTYGLFLVLFASCSRNTAPDPAEQLRISVAFTLAALPTPTLVPQPTSYPSPTPFNLLGLFCEYQFCIGHPAGMAFYDHFASLNQSTPSNYSNGFIVGYQIPDLLINVIWLQAPDTADPQFLLDTILNDTTDTRTGNLDVKLIRGMNVMYTSITTTIDPVFPYGGAGAWTCGDRVFAWISYTPKAETANPLFEEALARFTCG